MSARVAVCGLGRMGTAFAENLAADGHRVTVWNRTPRDPGDPGVTVAATPAEAARAADIVVVMVFDDTAARTVLVGQDGVASGGSHDALVVNATTLAPGTARELDREVRAAGLRYLEAPVLGSVPAVRQRALTVLTGGAPEDAADAEEVLNAWSTPEHRRHTGGVGSATALKLVANLAMGAVYAGLHDAVSLGADLGLGRDAVLDVLAAGPLGGPLAAKRQRLVDDHYGAADFTLAGLAKDLALATEAARGAGHPLTVVEAADRLANRRLAQGERDQDIAVLGRTPDHAARPE